jgi:hypothetical protein
MVVAAVDYCHAVVLLLWMNGEVSQAHLQGLSVLKVPAKEVHIITNTKVIFY